MRNWIPPVPIGLHLPVAGDPTVLVYFPIAMQKISAIIISGRSGTEDRDFTAYREDFSRFQSEFGFESFPDLKTCAEFCPPEQYAFESPIMRNHQKNMAGNQKILDYMKKRFTIPEDFTKQVTLSQLTQAEAIEYGVEHWRRNWGVLAKNIVWGHSIGNSMIVGLWHLGVQLIIHENLPNNITARDGGKHYIIMPNGFIAP